MTLGQLIHGLLVDNRKPQGNGSKNDIGSVWPRNLISDRVDSPKKPELFNFACITKMVQTQKVVDKMALIYGTRLGDIQ